MEDVLAFDVLNKSEAVQGCGECYKVRAKNKTISKYDHFCSIHKAQKKNEFLMQFCYISNKFCGLSYHSTPYIHAYASSCFLKCPKFKITFQYQSTVHFKRFSESLEFNTINYIVWSSSQTISHLVVMPACEFYLDCGERCFLVGLRLRGLFDRVKSTCSPSSVWGLWLVRNDMIFGNKFIGAASQ